MSWTYLFSILNKMSRLFKRLNKERRAVVLFRMRSYFYHVTKWVDKGARGDAVG